MANTILNIGTVATGAIRGATDGSVITANNLPTGFTINGEARTWRYDGTGTAANVTFTLIETYGIANNTPRVTIIPLSIMASNSSSNTSLSAPVLTQTSTSTANPLTMRAVFPDAVTHVGNGLQLQITQVESSNNVPDWSNALTEEQQITTRMTTDGVMVDSNNSLVYSLLKSPMSGGKTYARFREKKYVTFNKGLCSEGDSITVNASGWFYDWTTKNPNVKYTSNAQSGRGLNYPDASDLNGVIQQQQITVNAKPAVVAIYIGSNDIRFTDPDVWINNLWSHTTFLRNNLPGTRIIVGTLLPIGTAGYENHNLRRPGINAAIRAAVGVYIDAVMDFAADPVIGVDSATANNILWGPNDKLHPDGAIAYMQAIATPVLTQQYAIATTPLAVSDWSNVVVDTLSGAQIGAITKWDTTKANSYSIISSDGRTASGSAGPGGTMITLTTTSLSSGKVYLEHTLTAVGSRDNGYFYGLSLDAPPVNPANFARVGDGNNNGITTEGRNVYHSTNVITSLYSNPGANTSLVANVNNVGDTVGMAIDATPGSRKVWFRDAATGAWVNGDPAANTGGFSLPSYMQNVPIFFATMPSGQFSIKINTGHEAFVYTMPTGFRAWG